MLKKKTVALVFVIETFMAPAQGAIPLQKFDLRVFSVSKPMTSFAPEEYPDFSWHRQGIPEQD
jgi:hypothetical protein